MTTATNCGARIRKLRTERAWSQEKLAELARISPRTVQRLESGKAYAPHTLTAVAAAFEIDIKELISLDESEFKNRPGIEFIPRVLTGNELCSVVAGAHLFSRTNESLHNDTEVELVGRFIQDVHDTGEIWDEMEPMHHVQAEYRLTHSMDELEEFGFYVFASRKRRTYRVGMNLSPMNMSVATVLVLRVSNPFIVRLPSGKEVVATALTEHRFGPTYSGLHES